jgi:hypothetical protein
MFKLVGRHGRMETRGLLYHWNVLVLVVMVEILMSYWQRKILKVTLRYLISLLSIAGQMTGVMFNLPVSYER